MLSDEHSVRPDQDQIRRADPGMSSRITNHSIKLSHTERVKSMISNEVPSH